MRAFDHQEFLPLDSILEQKRRQGLSVSLVLPALNEAETIGDIVRTVTRELCGAAGLLDEVLVIDGGSGDGTAGIAEQAGARVYRADQIDPHVVAPPGKGTSMWKAQFVASGDIVVFADADIREFGSRFVYGLAAPLILHPQIQWAKAAYRRPFDVNGESLEDHGGRVTEILVRPLLSAFYPELAPVRQPLSGECAIRRSALAGVSFSSGYSVEMLLLLQLCRTYGMDAFAEVDMGVRHHRNRPPRELGVMAYAILRTFLGVAQKEGKLSGAGRLGTGFLRPAPTGAESVIVDEVMLPSAASLPRPAGVGGS